MFCWVRTPYNFVNAADTSSGAASRVIEMDGQSINILAIEDSVFDFQLLRETLNSVPRFGFELNHQQRLADGLEAIVENGCDIVLLDLMLPDCVGLATLDKVHDAADDIPIVVLTQLHDEDSGLEAVRRGAQDYLIKGHFDGPLLSRTILYAIQRKRAELAVRESIVQRERLEREVLSISTREQQRISHDLHDSVGQELTGLSLMAKSLTKRLAAKSLPEAEDAQLIMNSVQRVLNQVHDAVYGLAPVELDAQGLMVSLKRLVVTTAEQCDVECQFACDGMVPVADNNTATHLYRIAQESLQNAVKHSQANQIVIRLRANNGHIVLEICDDGKGIRESSDRPIGMGLHIMRYRARAIDATLDIDSPDGIGTTITCTLKQEPCHEHEPNQTEEFASQRT